MHAQKSWPAKTALFALRFYKAYLSLLVAGSCRFEPTCSRYAYEAIDRFGVKRGSWLALKRLLRCQPLSGKFGYDPVPERASDEMRRVMSPEARPTRTYRAYESSDAAEVVPSGETKVATQAVLPPQEVHS